MSTDVVIGAVRRWVEVMVVGLGLCPFAQRELLNDRVRFVTTEANDEEQLLIALEAELELLNNDPSIETTLLIHPQVLEDFFIYNEFLNLAEGLLRQMNLEGIYQVASFHPDYQFGGTDPADAENYTNRSPFPLLHIIREASLERAIAGNPDIDQVPAHNIKLMNDLGANRLKALLMSCHDIDDKGER